MQSGFRHAVAVYGSDDDLLRRVVPFLEEAVAAGDPALVAVRRRETWFRSALTRAEQIVSTAPERTYDRPASTICRQLERWRDHVATRPGRLHVVGEVLDPSVVFWEPWARYEAAINELYAGFPVTVLCVYDRRRTPDDVLAELERTHPFVVTGDGRHVVNDRYVEPRTFLSRRTMASLEPLERTPPFVELIDPVPSVARTVVADAARRGPGGDGAADRLVASVHEALVNAIRHGSAPVVLRIWIGEDRVVATVGDTGPGPRDVFAGLVPANGADGSPVGSADGRGAGFGLWIAHQLCDEAVHRVDHDGFTIRLTVGCRPAPPAC